MKTRILFLLIASSCVLFMAAGPGGKGGPGGGAAVEPAVVPDYLFNVVLGRPGSDRITASVLAWQDLEGYLAYGQSGGALVQRTPQFKLPKGQALELLIDKLKPDTQWQYQLNYRLPGSSEIYHDEIRTFQTQRSPASSFTRTSSLSMFP